MCEIDKIIEKHKPIIRRIVTRRLSSNRENDKTREVEDICQDIYLAICKNYHTLSDKSKIGAWIVNITKNCINHYYRKRYTNEKYMDKLKIEQQSSVFSPDQIDTIWKTDVKAIMREMIQKLSAEHREVLRLRYYEELSVTVIAGKLRIEPQKVSNYLSYARKLLRKEAELKIVFKSSFN